MPSSLNKGRNNFESIYIMLFTDNYVYKPFYSEIGNEVEAEDE